MIISKYGFEDIIREIHVTLDPSRIAAQVVSGMGFLGAGTIIIQKQIVKGLTTAAGMWVTAAIGLVIGSGLYEIGIYGAFLTLIVLEVFRQLSNRLLSRLYGLQVKPRPEKHIPGVYRPSGYARPLPERESLRGQSMGTLSGADTAARAIRQ